MPVFNGNRRANELTGTDRNDVLKGRGGADLLDGAGGKDKVLGGGGDDELHGGGGNDKLKGGAGADILFGDAGNDKLTGNAGADTFAFAAGWGRDTITDFNADQGDTIDLTETGASFADLVITQTGRGARITLGDDFITLKGVDASDVDASFFALEGAKAETTTTLSGSDLKVDILDDSGQPGVQTNAAADLLSMDEFRADARFSGAFGAGYTVAVLDTGIDLNHAAFGPDANGDGVSDRIVYHQDFSADRDGTADDVQGHGSHVSSIIASGIADYQGIAPSANIAALQVLTNSGSGAMAGIENALRWVVDNAAAYNIVAVNMSLGAGDNSNFTATNGALGDEFAALDALGVISVVAAGNDYFTHQAQGVSSIAADPNAIAVGAVWAGNFGRAEFGSGAKDFTTAADRLTSFSQRSTSMGEIFAPGAMITGAAPGGGFASHAGTSQATPMIAGMAALAQEIADDVLGRRLTADEFHSMLISSADTINDGDDEDDNVINMNSDVPRANMMQLAEAILALAPDNPTPTEDDFADSIGEASRIRARRDISGVIEVGSDQDFFALRLREGQQVVIDMKEAASGRNTLSDAFLTLYGPDGAAITSDDDGGDGLNARIDFTASQSGQYFIAAQSFGDNTGAYTLRAQTVPVRRSPDDDLPADASTSSTVSLETPATGVLETPGDRDWHALEVVAGGEYLFDLTAAGDNPLADPFLRVYDAEGFEIGSNDDNGVDLNSQLLFTANADGIIYLEAGAYNDAGEGDYQVAATLISAPDLDNGDVPDDASTDAFVEPGADYDGVLEPVGDRDWIAVSLIGGSVYDFSLAGTGDNPVADTFLRLYDAFGNELASDDDGGDAFNSLIAAFAPRSSGVYYLEAASYDDQHEGTYTVSVSEQGGEGGDLPATRETPSMLEVGGSVDSRLDFVGDRDWHTASLIAGHIYQLDLAGIGDDAVGDTYLRLYDGEATLVDENDDGGEGLNSSLIFTASRTGVHFVSAAAYNDSYEGDYTVILQDLGGTDDFTGDTSTSGRLPADGSTTGTLEIEGDRDWFQVSLVRGGTYQFDALGAALGDGTLTDPIMNLYSADGTMLAENDDGGEGLNSQITFFADTSGAYFVGVGGFGDARAGTYEVVSQTISGGDDDFGDDDTTDGDVAIGGSVAGSLETQGDTDWFAVELERGAEYRFDLGGPTLPDSTLTLLDFASEFLEFDDDGGEGLNSQITYEAAYSGVHYLAVRGYGDVNEGTYTLAAVETRAASSDDYGDTVAGSGQIALGGSVTGELEQEGDRDWLEIDLVEGDTYRFDLRGQPSGGGTLSDAFLRIRDAAGLERGYDDDGGVGYDSSLVYTADFTGAHYLDVQGYSSSTIGSWTLEAELV